MYTGEAVSYSGKPKSYIGQSQFDGIGFSHGRMALNSFHPLAKYVKSLWPLMTCQGNLVGANGSAIDVGPNMNHRTLGTAVWRHQPSGETPNGPPGLTAYVATQANNITLGDHVTYDGDVDYCWFMWFRPGQDPAVNLNLMTKQGSGADSFVLQWVSNENWTWDVREGTLGNIVTLSPTLAATSLYKWCLFVCQHDTVNNLAIFTIVDSRGKIFHGTTAMSGSANATAHSVVIGNVIGAYRMCGCLNGKVLSVEEIYRDLWLNPFGLIAPGAPPRRRGRVSAASGFGLWSRDGYTLEVGNPVPVAY